MRFGKIHFIWGIFLMCTWGFAQNLSCPEVQITDDFGNVDPTIDCDSETGCITLRANYAQTGVSTDYTVESIAYEPPFPYLGLANPISVNIDDVWSDPKIRLPFDFCFYDQLYRDLVVSSNGAISFDLSNINDNGTNSTSPGNPEQADECPWEFDLRIPDSRFPKSNIPKKIRNAIFGVFHDIDPSKGGQIAWEVFGSFPCRAFVVSYANVPLFECNDVESTFQMVLYESTNIIEVFIEKKSACNNWNNGHGLIGLTNADASKAITPEDRNTGTWELENEAWRFIPSGTSNTTVTWYDVTNGNIVLSNANEIEVCPSDATMYRVEVEYALCGGGTYMASKETAVTFSNFGFDTPALNKVFCDEMGDPDGFTTIDLNQITPELQQSFATIANKKIDYYLTVDDVMNGVSIPNPMLFLNTENPQTIYAGIENLDNNCTIIKEIILEVISGPQNATAQLTTAPFSAVNQVVVQADGIGEYQYNINGGPFQSSPVFDNVVPGVHLFQVMDGNMCGKATAELVIIDYPRFFTPNGDGINDTWQIIGGNNITIHSLVIFNRFGKQLADVTTRTKSGWDGMYNGRPMPGTDYWFRLIYSFNQENGLQREFTGHFSLKR